MEHLQPFCSRRVLPLPILRDGGWQLKRYAICANGKIFDEKVTTAAGAEAISRLPSAGGLFDEFGNHGVGFQIIHFAEVAVVSPVFYWLWGSVLANIDQMRANWETPTEFGNGVKEVVGCIWEMDIVSFEVNAWKEAILSGPGAPTDRLTTYLETRFS